MYILRIGKGWRANSWDKLGVREMALQKVWQEAVFGKILFGTEQKAVFFNNSMNGLDLPMNRY